MKDITEVIKLHGVEVLVVLVVVSLAWLVSSRPIEDNDFWWHLATGKYIAETGALPEQDPFSFTTPVIDGVDAETRTSMILKGYWLAQIILYSVFAKFSYWGIVSFKGGLYAVIVLFIYLAMRRGGMGKAPSALMLFPFFFPELLHYLNTWKGERPGHFSFAFSLIMVFLLEGVRKSALKGDRPHYAYLLAMVLVMPLWANIHGGYILGIAFICIYMLEIILIPLNRRKKIEKGRFIAMYAGLAAIVASAINPNGFSAIKVVVDMARAGGPPVTVFETRSPFAIWQMDITGTYLYYTIVVITLSLPVIRRMNLSQALVIVFLVSISFMALRHVQALVFVSYPIIITAWARLLEDRAGRFIPPVKAVVAALVVVVFLAGQTGVDKYKKMRAPLIGVYPFAAVGFIKRVQPEGQIFNYYDWGGFLIWKLYPKYKVFVDGRVLSFKTSYSYRTMRDNPDPKYWALMSEEYGINTAIVPAYDLYGYPVPVFVAILNSSDWVPVFMDSASVVFLRKTKANAWITGRMSIDRKQITDWAKLRRRS